MTTVDPIPLALLITELDPGGAERALVEIATRLDRRVWRPSVIGLGPEGALAQPLRDAGIDVECLGVRPRRPVQALTRLVRALRKRRPRLVQSFLFHANLAARLARPFVGPYSTVAGLRVAERGRRWHSTLDRWTSKWCDHWVCVSEGVRRHAIAEGGLLPDRLAVIPNGVSLDRFRDAVPTSKAELGMPDGARIALFVGRIDPQKGWRVLLDAIDSAMIRGSSWRLVIVGDGPEREAMLARIGDSGRARWLGRRDDVPSLMAAADVLVLPSLWEGMPNVVLEAMAAGKPVIATDVEGSQELVEPGATGWLVPPGDPQALAQAIVDAGADSDSDRLQRFGANARRIVADRYSWDQAARDYQRLWMDVLSRSATSPPPHL